MEFDQYILGVALIPVFIIHQVQQKAIENLPEEEQTVFEELLKPLWLSVVLIGLVILAESARLATGADSRLYRLVPPLLGFAATLLAFGIRRRAYRIYELATEANDKSRVSEARALMRKATWSFVGSSALWIGILLHRL